MGRPIRISDEIMRLAEADSVLSKRSPPKQIEFWAEIGRRIEQQLTQSDLIRHGVAGAAGCGPRGSAGRLRSRRCGVRQRHLGRRSHPGGGTL